MPTVLAPDTEHVDAAMDTAIDAATTIPVHRTVPSGAPYPYIKFRCISDVDNYVLRGKSWGRFLYDVTGWAKGSSAAAVKAQLRLIRIALTDAKPTVSGGTVMYLRREGRVEFEPVENGVQYQQVIDRYVIEVKPT